MKENFNFENVGKRMPYTVPDRFFDEMEKNVWRTLKEKPTDKRNKHRTFLRIVTLAITSAAAAVALFFVLNYNQPVGIDEVDEAFDNLSMEDQSYLLSVYQDDIFINQQTNF